MLCDNSLFYLIQRHSRSEKLLNGGRLKRYLNSDGEEEVISDDDYETHAERHARIIALAQVCQFSVDRIAIFECNPFDFWGQSRSNPNVLSILISLSTSI